MKKAFIIILSIFLFTSINVDAAVKSSYSYSEAQKILKEVIRSYYIRGPFMQYNLGRATFGTEPPEDATSQNILYSVCAAFTNDVYQEAFGMNFATTVAITVETGRNNKTNKNMVVYYEKTNGKTGDKRVVNERIVNGKALKSNETINYIDFIQKLKPGDVLAYSPGTSGHNLIVYDLIYENGKVKDVLLVNSTQGNYIRSRINGTTQLSYNMFSGKKGSPIFNTIIEGNIKAFKMSTDKHFFNKVGDGKLACQKLECLILRGVYDDGGKATFNTTYSSSQYKESKLRLTYPAILTDKTVDKNDSNSVYLNDYLVYSIKVKNMSNISNTYNSSSKKYVNDGVTYKNLVIEEEYNSNLVSFQSFVKYSGTRDGTKLIWNISELKPGEEVTIKYKVKVKDNEKNINKEIVSKGKFYKKGSSSVYIELAKVKNKIIPRAQGTMKDSYKNCYNNKKKSYSGLKLLNEIYKCAWGKDYKFDKFEFSNIISKKSVVNKKTAPKAITLKSNLDSTNKTFVNMILNNYWSGTVYFNENAAVSNGTDGYEDEDEYDNAAKGTIIILPRWKGATASKRAETIDKEDFKEGDLLIYYIKSGVANVYETTKAKDNGLYAYIYINGKFVGINSDRNEFTYKYHGTTCNSNIKAELYAGCSGLTDANREKVLEFVNYQTLYGKDYYVILRPELVMTESKATPKPTVAPTQPPTKAPTQPPTKAPTTAPTQPPTTAPTMAPTQSPTTAPTTAPTQPPTTAPTQEPTPTSGSFLAGDVDGKNKVDNRDYVLVRNHILKKKLLTGEELKRADVDGNNKVDNRDYVLIRNIILGK